MMPTPSSAAWSGSRRAARTSEPSTPPLRPTSSRWRRLTGDSVESLDDLTPAIERYHTLVGLGRYDDAYRLFRDRLSDATLYRLAAHRERIAWFERLFPDGVESLPALTDEVAQTYTLNTLARATSFPANRAGRYRSLERP